MREPDFVQVRSSGGGQYRLFGISRDLEGYCLSPLNMDGFQPNCLTAFETIDLERFGSAWFPGDACGSFFDILRRCHLAGREEYGKAKHGHR